MTAEYKRVDQALRESESRTRAITDSAQDAILMMDPQGIFRTGIPQPSRSLATKAKRRLGNTFITCLRPSDISNLIVWHSESSFARAAATLSAR